MRELVALYMRDESCLLQGSTGVSPDGTLVKIGLWRDRKAADTAAQHPRSLALRSQLIVLCTEHPVEEAYDLSGGLRKEALRSGDRASPTGKRERSLIAPSSATG